MNRFLWSEIKEKANPKANYIKTAKEKYWKQKHNN